jgi:dTDP-4-amino-4,6-dideoxygalactose transaminase
VLRARLPSELTLLGERPDTPCVFHLFPARHPERDRLVELVRAEGVEVGIHYTPAAHRHEAFDGLPACARPVELPESEAWAREELSLPMFAELEEHELERVVEACESACERLQAVDG